MSLQRFLILANSLPVNLLTGDWLVYRATHSPLDNIQFEDDIYQRGLSVNTRRMTLDLQICRVMHICKKRNSLSA